MLLRLSGISFLCVLLICSTTLVGAETKWEMVNGQWRIVHPAFPTRTRVNEERLQKYSHMDDQELRATINNEGVPPRGGNTNREAKDAVLDLAQKYEETGDIDYAHKAAVLLHRFAEVFPEWPFYSRGERVPQSETPPYWGSMWGTSNWYYYDLEIAAPLVRGWDLIRNSGAMEALGAGVPEIIERDLLRRHVDIYKSYYPRIFGNVDANLINGCMIWGLCLGDPELIHHGVRWIGELYRVGFYPSGVWHEQPGGYHLMIGCRLEITVLNNPLKGYSDPPDWRHPVHGTRFDDLDLVSMYQPQMDKVVEVARRTIFPNGRFMAIHDSEWFYTSSTFTSGGHMLRGVKDYAPTEQHPYILFDFGHAIMASGRDEDQSQVHLHFSGVHGHEHLDNLNIILFAKGKELLSETHYRATPTSTRQWQASTAAHNTVVIDERDQNRRSGPNTRRRNIDLSVDSVPDVPDFDVTNDHNNTFHHGNLLVWETNHIPVQVAEACGQNAYYPNTPDIYRRIVSKIQSSGPDFYVVDIFRVKGGDIHDWMLHGNLEENYRLETNLAMRPASFRTHGHISVEKAVKTANPLEFRFVSPGGEVVRTLMTGSEGTEVLIGQGPAMRNPSTAPFLDVRRRGGTSIYVAVHEPYIGWPKVKRITELPLERGSGEYAVALKIELEDRTDYFLSTMGHEERVVARDGSLNLSLNGRAGYVSVSDDKVTKLYLVDGTRLGGGGRRVTARAEGGVVTGSLREEDGEGMNAFEIDGNLPAGEVLKGRTIILTDGEGSSHGFEIERVERERGRTRVLVTADHGVKITDGLYKMLFFPNWGVKGEITYHVPGVALREF